MRYKLELGISGNLKELYKQTTRIDSNTQSYRGEAEQANLQLQADIVESVIDEYNALTEV